MTKFIRHAAALVALAMIVSPVAGKTQTRTRSQGSVALPLGCVRRHHRLPRRTRLAARGQRTFTKAEFKNEGVEVTFNSYLGMAAAFQECARW